VATGRLTASPVLEAVAPSLARLPGDGYADIAALNALVTPGMVTGGGQPLRFIPPPPAGKSFDAHYEVSVYRTGAVPTREANAHDFFNALAWLSFPRTKAAINRLHYEALVKQGHASGARGKARDVLTLLDEGGVVVLGADAALADMLRAFRWKELFWERREDAVANLRFFVLGHAILEKAVEPYKSLTAKALIFDVSRAFLDRPLDQQLARADELAAQWLAAPGSLESSRSIPPLPVMGVPGWHAGQDAAFYDDAAVFRPARGTPGRSPRRRGP
jgi:hypothetical protein